jgi:protease II
VAWKNGREYSVIYRRKLNDQSQEELVLDIMQYPQISRHYKTIELLKTSFSPSHRYIAFGVDLKNNERISFLFADTHHPKRELKKVKVGEET